MKKVCTYLTRLIMFMALSLVLLSGRGITAKAVTVTYDKVYELHMINKKTTSSNYGLVVLMDEEDIHVSNIRTNSKYLKAKLYDFHRRITNPVGNAERIQLIATKKGSYYLTFDIVDRNGKFISSEKAKIIVETLKDSYKGYKSIKVGKKNILHKCLKDDYTSKYVDLNKSGKLKIKMKKGYTLKDIKVERYEECKTRYIFADGTERPTTIVIEHIKNGDKIKLSKISRYHNADGYEGGLPTDYYDYIFEYTFLTLTYADKSGNERQNEITIRSRIK